MMLDEVMSVNSLAAFGTNKQKKKTKKNSVALTRKQTIPAERPPLVGQVIANFCG
jgi:hypothetical protein